MSRLSHIVTRSGDEGQTGLADGSRVDKDSPRIAALGDLDELNAALGLLCVELSNAVLQQNVTDIQQQLFNLGGELALPGTATCQTKDIVILEQLLEKLNGQLPPLREFVLPGGTRASAQAHLARAICRRCERTLWQVSRLEAINPESLKYLNRLSDLLFVLSRTLARQETTNEPLWERDQ
jgi:cob(I)alamin adenosyltransferase